MVYRGMCTYQRSKQYTYVQCRGKVMENCHRSFFLVQWQLSYEETVKHVLADERRIVLDIES